MIRNSSAVQVQVGELVVGDIILVSFYLIFMLIFRTFLFLIVETDLNQKYSLNWTNFHQFIKERKKPDENCYRQKFLSDDK